MFHVISFLCLLLGAALTIVATPAAASYRLVHQGSSDRILIFVHGLWGDPEETFTAGTGSPSWLDIIAKDHTVVRSQSSLSTYSVAVLSYPTSRADRLSVSQVARVLTRSMRDAGLLESKAELYFVAHSLGGLVIKEILLNAVGSADTRPLFQRTQGLFLISTPTSGSGAADFITNKLPQFATGRIIADVKSIGDNTYLQSMQERWDNLIRLPPNQRPFVYCAYETRPTMGLDVVPQQYSEKFCDEAPEAMNEDHISIVKPKSTSAQIHSWLRGSLADAHLKRASRAAPVAKTVREPQSGPVAGREKTERNKSEAAKQGTTEKMELRRAERKETTSAAQSGTETRPTPSARTGKDCTECPDLVPLQAGSFIMGSTEGEQDEIPPHRVVFTRRFSMGKSEVTVRQWRQCVGDGICADVIQPAGSTSTHPVVNVTWAEARAFADWLSRKTGKKYRLPSEAEWEYAARANGVAGDGLAVHCRGCAGAPVGRSVPSAGLPANGFGFHAMLGNVAEWVLDCRTRDYSTASSTGAPAVEGSCSQRGVRGGSWFHDRSLARPSSRSFEAADRRAPYLGFRVLRED